MAATNHPHLIAPQLDLLRAPRVVSDGGPVTYTLVVHNFGPDQALWDTTTFTLPVGGSLLTASGAPTVVGSVLTWTTPVLAPGESITYTIRVNVVGDAFFLVAVAESVPSTSEDFLRFADEATAVTLVLTHQDLF